MALFATSSWADVPADTYYSFTQTVAANGTISPTSGVSSNIITCGSSGSVASQSATFANQSYSYGLKLGNTTAKGCTIGVSASTTNPAHIILFCSGSSKDIYLYDGSTKITTGYTYGVPSVVDLTTTKTGELTMYASGDVYCYYIQVLYEGNDNIFTDALNNEEISIPATLTASSKELCFFRPCEFTITDGKFKVGGGVSGMRRTVSFKSHVTGTLTVGIKNTNSSGRTASIYSVTDYKTLGDAIKTTSSLAKDKTATLEVDVTKDNYYAIGANGSDIQITSISLVPTVFNIKYEENGHGEAQEDLTGQTKLPNSLPVLSETGWTFGGWFINSDLAEGHEAEAGATINANTTLYAKWTQNNYSVTYALGDGTGTTPTETSKHYGDKFYLHDGETDITAPTGQEFAGWNDGTSTYNGGVQYTMPAENITLTAQWRAATTKSAINYAELKGADNSANPTEYAEGIGIASFEPLSDVAGFHFTGWSPASIGTSATGEQTITAQWVATYSVTYNLNGAASGTLPTETVKYATQEFTLAAQGDIVAPDGKQFLGWKDQDGVKYDAGDTYTMPAKAVTLTAYWAATHETIIYYWEGASAGAVEIGGTAAGKLAGKDTTGLINQAQGGFYNLKVEGNNSYSTSYIEISLDDAIKTGDKIKYWGFYFKESNKSARPKMRDGKTPYATIFDDPTNLPNLYSGGDPAERTFTVPADINTNKVQITRSQTGSNTWISKLLVIRELYTDEDDLYVVSFAAGDGTGEMASIKYAEDDAVLLPVSTFTAPAGKIFDAWTSSDVTITNGLFTMPAQNVTVTATWKTDPATSLDNTTDEAKAVKFIENGMLIIEKNGVRYNAQGQVIK